MEDIWKGFCTALRLILSLDPEVIEISALSLRIAITSTILSAFFCLPLGSVIHFNEFPGKRLFVNIIQTLYSVPTVVVGLFVFVMLSSTGPLGRLELLFTPTAIIIGQALLIAPILLGMTISNLKSVDKSLADTARSLGAGPIQMGIAVIKEARYSMISAMALGFGRAVSEVGLAIMVGGNIKGFTRTLTTAISLETSKGNVELSMALGIVLLATALVVNTAANRFQQA